MELQRKEYPALLVSCLRASARPTAPSLLLTHCPDLPIAPPGRQRPQRAHEACRPAELAHCRLAAGASDSPPCPYPPPRHVLTTPQERRRVEELYVQGLRKLANRHPPDESSDLGYLLLLPI
jgi:hypothetical protein